MKKPPPNLLDRALRKAGSIKLLAKAMGYSVSAVYSWRAHGVPSRPYNLLRLYLKDKTK